MATLKASINQASREVRVQKSTAATPSGFTAIGTFDHPDPVYPDSLVIFHGVRDLLYHRSDRNPAQPAKFPFNITDVEKYRITTSDLT